MINLNININKEIIISLLSVSNDNFYNFKLNAFKAIIFDEVFFKIEMKLSRLLISFLTKIICFFLNYK